MARPAQLNGEKEGTFVYKTIVHRWPEIVTKCVDSMHRRRDELIARFGEDVDEDLKATIHSMSEMRYQLMTNKPLTGIVGEEANGHYGEWMDKYTKEVGTPTWYNVPWLFVECYLYRRIWSFFAESRFLKNEDVFAHQKQASFIGHIPQISDAAKFLEEVRSIDASDEIRATAITLSKMCLWGNQADLSLSGGKHVEGVSPTEAAAARDSFLLTNDLDSVVDRVILPFVHGTRPHDKKRRLDVVLDNAGVELVADLVLVDFLLHSAKAFDVVHLHGKPMPWFVSDVTPSDFSWTLEELAKLPAASNLADRLSTAQRAGRLVFSSHAYFCYSQPFETMQFEAQDLWNELSASNLLIFKGDLNYRKLIGDRPWKFDTPMKKALGEFTLRPILALRTLKAECLAGLSAETAATRDENDLSWMVTGEYAVAQLID